MLGGGTGVGGEVERSQIKNNVYSVGNKKISELKKYLGTLPGVEKYKDFYFGKEGAIRIVNGAALVSDDLKLAENDLVNKSWMKKLEGILTN